MATVYQQYRRCTVSADGAPSAPMSKAVRGWAALSHSAARARAHLAAVLALAAGLTLAGGASGGLLHRSAAPDANESDDKTHGHGTQDSHGDSSPNEFKVRNSRNHGCYSNVGNPAHASIYRHR